MKSKTFKAMPKGECFRNVIFYLKERGGLTSVLNDGAFVVHGKVTNVDGKTYWHAWIEQGSKIIDPTQGVTLSKNRYYISLQIDRDQVKRYPFEEALILSIRNQHYGPWE